MIRRWLVCAIAMAGIACAKTHQLTDTSSTLIALASSNPRIATFVAMVETSGMSETMRGSEAVTVLAPTNEAITALGEERIRYLMSADGAVELDALVNAHVFPGSYSSEDVARGKLPRSMAGEKIVGSKAPDGTPRINGDGKLLESMMGSNGFVHVIDTLLQPSR